MDAVKQTMQPNTPYAPDTLDEDKMTTSDVPSQPIDSRPLSERLMEAAVVDLGIDAEFVEEFVEFTEVLIPSENKEGDLIVRDKDDYLKYNMTTGVLSTTSKYEWFDAVSEQNQRADATKMQMARG